MLTSVPRFICHGATFWSLSMVLMVWLMGSEEGQMELDMELLDLGMEEAMR